MKVTETRKGLTVDGKLYVYTRSPVCIIGDVVKVRTIAEDEWFGKVISVGRTKAVAHFEDYNGKSGDFYVPKDYTMGSYPMGMGIEAVLYRREDAVVVFKSRETASEAVTKPAKSKAAKTSRTVAEAVKLSIGNFSF